MVQIKNVLSLRTVCKMRSPKDNSHNAVLVRFWKYIFVSLCFLTIVIVGADECNFHVPGSTPDDESLLCAIETLDENFLVTNLTAVLISDPIRKVTVSCSDLYYLQTVLTQNAFRDLFHLAELSILHCKLSKIDSDAFVNLRTLRNLTIKTYNSDLQQSSLTIAHDLLRPLQHLETLDLSTNSIWELPSGIFCPLVNLKALNLSTNHLQDLTQLGFSGTPSLAPNRTKSCRSAIKLLDLSNNDADVLASGALERLDRLENLYLYANKIAKVDDEAFRGLSSLNTLDLSGNRLVALPENAFMYTPHLMYLHVRNNSLTTLSAGLFRGLEELLVLDLSYNALRSEWLTESSFQGLIRLMSLDLSHNKMLHLNPQVFRDMSNVQVLRLSHNLLTTLPPSAFSHCVNLHTLDLSHNKIRKVRNKVFDGVSVLSFLSLNNNEISEVGEEAFANLTSLEDLNINNNRLAAIPKAISYLRLLSTLDLGDNQITSLLDTPIKGLQSLYGLRLVSNRISGNITKEAFADIPSLRVLNLAKNNIRHIETGAFWKNQNLRAIRLDANALSAINDLFDSLPNLEWLNVSDNNIEHFDYQYIPSSLLWLDIHKNKISSLDNNFGRHDLKLQTLDASANNIRRISSFHIPKGVQLLFLNHNEISVVEPFTFVKNENLTRVDLYSNKITKMDKNALRITDVPVEKRLPEFYIGNNSFLCDCHMEWLQRMNDHQDSRNQPTIADLENIYCNLPYVRGGTYLPLVEVQPSEFLCQYKTHCFAVCHCCEFDACDCEMTCPEGCGCYHDEAWGSNIVNCSSQGMLTVPDRIPMDATEVYLDGSNFQNLSSHSFIGRKYLEVLFVNSSQISVIRNGTFSGLSKLMVLHLEHNLLQSLEGHEFKKLNRLRELYLHNNNLKYIDQHTFMLLSHLEVLTLHNNKLVNFPVWRMVDNPYLTRISLRENPWTCNCQFVESFEIWLSNNHRKVSDSSEIKCISALLRKPDAFIMEFNASSCLNSSTSTVIQPMILDNLLHPVIAISVAFVVVILLLICFFYRNSIKVFVFSRCGLRFCQSKSPPDDKDKLFDAFVSYSSKDEAWVNQVLAAELERGEKPYRMCLHYRDFPVTAYITDTMVEAVESSKRTIIVLSKNFIENEWCRFQFKSAHHEVLKKKRKKLIVIVLGDIPSKDLDPDLRLYLKTNTCIHCNDKLFWEKLKFAMPDVSNSQRIVHTYSTIPDRSGANNKYSVNSVQRPINRPGNVQTDAYWA